MVFARQWFVGHLIEDRVSAIAEEIAEFPLCGELRVETPDTNEGKELQNFVRVFRTAQKTVAQETLLAKEVKNRPVLHVMFLSNSALMLVFHTVIITRHSTWGSHAYMPKDTKPFNA